MTNMERAVAILEQHREGRQWDDKAVAAHLLRELGVDPAASRKEPDEEADERQRQEAARIQAEREAEIAAQAAAKAKADEEGADDKASHRHPARGR